MKTLRIVNRDNTCVYVERQYWFRVSPKFSSNIEAWNWARKQRGARLVTKSR